MLSLRMAKIALGGVAIGKIIFVPSRFFGWYRHRREVARYAKHRMILTIVGDIDVCGCLSPPRRIHHDAHPIVDCLLHVPCGFHIDMCLLRSDSLAFSK
jgi:hypothetical protein